MAGTLYDWLGIDPAASADEIRDALGCKVLELTELRKRLRLHPDPHTEKLIRLGFLKIAQARDSLLNPKMRLAYDRSLENKPSLSPPPDMRSESTSMLAFTTKESPGVPNLEPSEKQPKPVRLPDELVDLTAYPLAEADQSPKPDLALPKTGETHPLEWLSGLEVPLPLELLDKPGTFAPEPLPPQRETEELPDWLKSYTLSESESANGQTEPEAAPPHLGMQDLPYWLVDQELPPSHGSAQAEVPVVPDPSQSQQDELPSWLAGFESSPSAQDAQESESTMPASVGSQANSEESPDWLRTSIPWVNNQAAVLTEPESHQAAEQEVGEIPDWLAGLPIPKTRQTQPLPPEPPDSQLESDYLPSSPVETQDTPAPNSAPATLFSEYVAASAVKMPPADAQPVGINRESSDFSSWLESLPPMEIGESPDWLDDLDAYLTTPEPIPLEPISDPEPPLFSVTPHLEPPQSARNASLPGPGLPPSASVESVPAIVHPSKTVEREITRYGQVDYYTPLDKGCEYPLRIGLFLEHHDKRLLKDAHIRWATLSMASNEVEPIIRIIPSSKFLRISPPAQELKVKKYEDVFADFRVLPLQVPKSPDHKCDLRIDFLLRDRVIQTVDLDVKVQWRIRLGPLQISHMHWKWFGLIGIFDTAAGLFGFLTPTGSLANLLILSGSLLFGLSLLIISLLLWQKAAKRLQSIF